jgi:hypothetical protein
MELLSVMLVGPDELAELQVSALMKPVSRG